MNVVVRRVAPLVLHGVLDALDSIFDVAQGVIILGCDHADCQKYGTGLIVISLLSFVFSRMAS